ncbi:DUF5615 family PIN-like protein [Isoptericola sp. b441]|uniref:DUF5615 family PIN-like protein n=1 Tax=Actinotalea lenta TaxID=3064654 RepID=A0ABT9D6A5_9CELL|nr:DUF5615 family PIN-like protein [Isoptericola sp. b441]MDO8106030.1 DUF5615 family PIN-like protein [Isoptericola sp. b441]
MALPDDPDHPAVTMRVHPDLRFLLPPGRRGGHLSVRAWPTDTVGHVVQDAGIPLTEVGALTLNGEPVDPGGRVAPGTLDVDPVLRPQPTPTMPPRFLLDVHLGTLARRLRLLGLDTTWSPDAGRADDAELVARAADEDRVLLTQDRRLLHRRALRFGALVRGHDVADQLDDVLDRFTPPLLPWTRCVACGAPLRKVRRADVVDLLEPGTLRTYDAFSQCTSCGRAYWRGAHASRLEELVDHARGVVAARLRAAPP